MATAAEQTRPETLKWLLEKEADPNAEGINGDRALDWAYYRADQSRIDLLRRLGATPGAATRASAYPRQKVLPTRVLPSNEVCLYCWRRRRWCSRPVAALRVTIKPYRFRLQSLHARKAFPST